MEDSNPSVGKKACRTEEEWADKWLEIVVEHDLQGARDISKVGVRNLRDFWALA